MSLVKFRMESLRDRQEKQALAELSNEELKEVIKEVKNPKRSSKKKQENE